MQAASMIAAVALVLATLASPIAVGSSSSDSGSSSGSTSSSGLDTGTGSAAGSGWDPASLHLFVDHEGLAEISGLELVEHRPFKTYDMAVEPSEPWDGGMRHPLRHSSIFLIPHTALTAALAASRRTDARAHRGLLFGGPGLRERDPYLL